MAGVFQAGRKPVVHRDPAEASMRRLGSLAPSISICLLQSNFWASWLLSSGGASICHRWRPYDYGLFTNEQGIRLRSIMLFKMMATYYPNKIHRNRPSKECLQNKPLQLAPRLSLLESGQSGSGWDPQLLIPKRWKSWGTLSYLL